MTKIYLGIGIPRNIQINKNFYNLQIIRRWFHLKIVFLTLFVIIWDAFLINWYVMAFTSSAGFLDLMFFLFPLLHVAVGAGLTYYVLTGYLNKTVIEVNHNYLTIKHGPLPVWGNKEVTSKNLIQLYCKRDRWLNLNNSYQFYAVHAITSDRKNIKLLSGLDTSEQALYIEQEIETFLKIPDRPVKGALG